MGCADLHNMRKNKGKGKEAQGWFNLSSGESNPGRVDHGQGKTRKGRWDCSVKNAAGNFSLKKTTKKKWCLRLHSSEGCVGRVKVMGEGTQELETLSAWGKRAPILGILIWSLIGKTAKKKQTFHSVLNAARPMAGRRGVEKKVVGLPRGGGTRDGDDVVETLS